MRSGSKLPGVPKVARAKVTRSLIYTVSCITIYMYQIVDHKITDHVRSFKNQYKSVRKCF